MFQEVIKGLYKLFIKNSQINYTWNRLVPIKLGVNYTTWKIEGLKNDSWNQK